MSWNLLPDHPKFAANFNVFKRVTNSWLIQQQTCTYVQLSVAMLLLMCFIVCCCTQFIFFLPCALLYLAVLSLPSFQLTVLTSFIFFLLCALLYLAVLCLTSFYLNCFNLFFSQKPFQGWVLQIPYKHYDTCIGQLFSVCLCTLYLSQSNKP